MLTAFSYATLALPLLLAVVLGLALHLIAYWLIEGRNFRLMGVLQRIGICFAIVGLIAIHVRSVKIQWLIIGAILIVFILMINSNANAAVGDTTIVTAQNAVHMSSHGNYSSWAVFPDGSKKYGKLM